MSSWQPGTPTASLPQSSWQPTTPPAASWQPQQAWPDPGPWHPPLKADAGLPPSWHAPLRTDLIPLPQPRKRRRTRIILIAAAVVVLLIAGVTTWLAWPPDRSPFEQAVANLAAQPVVNYTSTLPDGTVFDGRVTKQGDSVGWLTGDTMVKFRYMILNGQLFVRVDGNVLPHGISGDFDANRLKNRWITGDLGALASLANQNVTPTAIADRLRAEVAATPKLPTPSDDGTLVDGVPVLKADTPNGTLYVAKDQPYRVVRWIDKGTRKSTVAFADPGRKLQLNGTRASYSGLGTVDFTPMDADDVDRTYDDLEADTGQLGDAVNTGMVFHLDDIDNLDSYNKCEQTGCTVTAHLTSAISGSLGQLPSTVDVQMTAEVSVDGIPAGSCSTTAKEPSHGSYALSCVDTDMHAAFAQADAKALADALAKSNPNDDYVYYSVLAEVHVYPYALASLDLTAVGKRLESARPDHACGWTDKGGAGRTTLNLYDKFDARLDTARFPDFEIHVFQDGRPYGDFGPSGWFAKQGGVAVPAGPPAKLNDLLKNAAVAFMKASGTLKDGDDTSGDKWKRPASHC
ncbi:hypothetical protein [Kutzneria buriramensis]|uniref:hypothetical protein n=1 Tax=Kutzneria buriramensis TaxID=1045776 RepID=UPI000E24BC16|nr:hypothetical protein [Kutzneria buriramensis]